MSRILALDIGQRRIGVAVSDALNMTAQGVGVIDRKTTKNVVEGIKDLIKQYDIGKIIVGMPFNMNGSRGSGAENIDIFLSLLRKDISLEIITVDERLTTAQGERVLIEADISRKKRKGLIDKIAAQLILQTYLDSNV